MKLHIGGKEIKEGWSILNIQKKDKGVDFVGDISDLSQFENNSVQEIYASHVVEHIDQKNIKKTLKGIYRILQDGDAVNVDVTAIVDEHYGDTSRMFCIGKTPVKLDNLINATYESMMRAIKILKPGIKLGDIGYEIQSYVEKKGFSVVRDFCGHGISTTFHEPPNILHYGTKNTGIDVKPGMTFTIEPMINAGKFPVKMLNDGWTAVTKDKSLSAQFEHTVGITENGYEIFTESAKTFTKPPYL